MTHQVAVKEFEGPLGLLLELVERGRLEVTAISVGQVTAQYLERTKMKSHIQPDELGEFLQLGTRLLYIKSLALLPRASTDEQLEELTKLNLELAEYRRFQRAAKLLASRGTNRSWPRSAVVKLAPEELPLPELDLAALAEAFQRALRRAEPKRPSITLRRQISQAELETRLTKRLDHGPLALEDELDATSDRLEIIVLFMALLELIRSGVVRVVQDGQFAPILIELAQ